MLRDAATAVERYRSALAADPRPGPREICSMYQQATLLASIVGTEHDALELDMVFRGETP